MFYLPVGMAIGPGWLGLAAPDPIADARLLEHLTEFVVVVSLFTVGLKLSVAVDDRRWLLPLRLALGSMAITVGLITLLGLAVGLPLGAAVLLGAILAPTDPVLASDVQISDPQDRSRLRLALTGEGGLNDGTAFPFVMLGLGLLGAHPIGDWGLRWLLVDLLWAVAGGLAIGAALGTLVGRLILHLRLRYHHAVGYDDFLALGLIGLAYGAALMAHTYGFLAVFAAGVALRRVERDASQANLRGRATPTPDPPGSVEQSRANPMPLVDADHAATDPARAPAFMAHAMLGANEQIERIGEVAAVVLIGAMLWAVDWSLVTPWFVPALLLVVRPVSVAISLAGSNTEPAQRRLIAWFGVRGIGSLYDLGYAMNHGLDPSIAPTLVALTIATVVASIVAHGVSVTPLMHRYESRRARRTGDPGENRTWIATARSRQPMKNPKALAALLDAVRTIACQAGEVVLQVYAQPFAARYKSDASPVTEADERAESLIIPALQALTPGVPVVAEEAAAAGLAPASGPIGCFWLVDPLDGTKEFLARNGEFTVNIALIENGEPVLGVVFAPALGQLYLGAAGLGAWFEPFGLPTAAANAAPAARRRIHVRPTPADGLTVVGSRSHGQSTAVQAYLADLPIREHRQVGSSLKLCLIAAGEADLYPRFGRTMEWDIAAGHAVLAAAGGSVSTLDGQALSYGKPGFENPDLIATGSPIRR